VNASWTLPKKFSTLSMVRSSAARSRALILAKASSVGGRPDDELVHHRVDVH
jgi:hypothetical protein